jgi:hypothetical protein
MYQGRVLVRFNGGGYKGKVLPAGWTSGRFHRGLNRIARHFISPTNQRFTSIKQVEEEAGYTLPLVATANLVGNEWKGKKAKDQKKEEIEIEDENEAKMYQGRVLIHYNGGFYKRKVLPAGWTSGRFHSGPKRIVRLYISPINHRFASIKQVQEEVGYTLPVVAIVNPL